MKQLNEILVIKSFSRLDEETMKKVRKEIKEQVGDIDFLVLQPGFEIAGAYSSTSEMNEEVGEDDE
jgi:short-subunit dehydrogenase